MTAVAVDDEPMAATQEQEVAPEQSQVPQPVEEAKQEEVQSVNADATNVVEQVAAEEEAQEQKEDNKALVADIVETPAAENVEQKQVEQDNQTQD